MSVEGINHKFKGESYLRSIMDPTSGSGIKGRQTSFCLVSHPVCYNKDRINPVKDQCLKGEKMQL